MYDVSTNDWTSGPPLRYGRTSHACTTLKDTSGNFAHVLVSGGFNGQVIRYTEILNLATMTWSPGPHLQTGIIGGTLSAADPQEPYVGAYFIGGRAENGNHSSSVYGLAKDMSTWFIRSAGLWEVGKLNKARYEHIAVCLPPDFLPGCSYKCE